MVDGDADLRPALQSLWIAVGDDRVAELGRDGDARLVIDKLQRSPSIDAASWHALDPNPKNTHVFPGAEAAIAAAVATRING